MNAMIVFFCITAFICAAANAGGVYPAAPVAAAPVAAPIAAPVAAPVYTVSRPYTYSTYRVYANNFKGSPVVAAPVAAAPVAAAPYAAAVSTYPAAPVAAVGTYSAAPVAAAIAAPVATAAVAAPVAAPLTYTYTSYAGYGYPYYGAYVGYIKK
ncbi:hypothetical protein AVEN_39089-1 [Araneus ventricosus]|uniref:Uncharacterized protein n=1 Tax=Araneus ventricosus TaxID=182803 RepID=A0A4Y2DH45_ARAVE|nr:hypothetical protein AVEN_39089-1 [Araneus ventricosus]